MKARVYPDKSYGGSYSDEDLSKIECSKDWELTENLPNPNFVKPFYINYDWVETINEAELLEIKKNKIQSLDEEYTRTISELVDKHVQKFITRNIPIPKEILDEQQRLINEFHDKINKL